MIHRTNKRTSRPGSGAGFNLHHYPRPLIKVRSDHGSSVLPVKRDFAASASSYRLRTSLRMCDQSLGDAVSVTLVPLAAEMRPTLPTTIIPAGLLLTVPAP